VSYPVKLTLFLLAFNIIGFAEGYLLHELGLLWVVPIILATAFGAVLAHLLASLVIHIFLSVINPLIFCLGFMWRFYVACYQSRN
jgi:hypothetical protein